MGGTQSSPKNVARPVVHQKSLEYETRTPRGSVTFDHKPLTQPFIPVLTKALVERSSQYGSSKEVHLDAFVDLVFPDTPDLGKRMFRYLLRYYHDQAPCKKEECCAIPEKDFVNVLDAKFQDACGQDNLNVFLTLFSAQHGLAVMTQENFREFLLICYEAASCKKRTEDAEEDSVISALVTSAYHQKQEVNIGYLQGWVKRNCPLLIQPLVRYVIHRLSTAHESVGDSEQKQQLPYIQELPIVTRAGMAEECGDEERSKVLHPALLWILATSMPEIYSKPTKGTPQNKSRFPTLSEIEEENLFAPLDQLTNLSVPRKWSLLYDTDDHGMAMNRFLHHVMKYRGPTIMIITAECGFRFCLGVDEEWKDTGSYWGKSDSCILELGPELHVLATGEKIVCFNSSIRGYPIGLSLGPDPREPIIRIGASWSKLEFKKIPLSLVRIVVFGAGEALLVETQEKLRKARDDYAVSRRVVDRKKMLEEYEVDKQILSMGSAPSNFNADRFRRPIPPE